MAQGDLGNIAVSVWPSMAGAYANLMAEAQQGVTHIAETFERGLSTALPTSVGRAFGVAGTASVGAFEHSAGPAMAGAAERVGAQGASAFTKKFVADLAMGLLPGALAHPISQLISHFSGGGQRAAQVFSSEFTTQVATSMQALGEGNVFANLERSISVAASNGARLYSAEVTRNVATGMQALGPITEENIVKALEAAGIKGGQVMAAAIAEGLTSMGAVGLHEAVDRVMSGAAVHGGSIFAPDSLRNMRIAYSAMADDIMSDTERAAAAIKSGLRLDPQVFKDMAKGAETMWVGGIPAFEDYKRMLMASAIELQGDLGKTLLNVLPTSFSGLAEKAIPSYDQAYQQVHDHLVRRAEETGRQVTDALIRNTAKAYTERLTPQLFEGNIPVEERAAAFATQIANTKARLKADLGPLIEEIAAMQMAAVEKAFDPTRAENIYRAVPQQEVLAPLAGHFAGYGREGIGAALGSVGSEAAKEAGQLTGKSLLAGIAGSLGAGIAPTMKGALGALKELGGAAGLGEFGAAGGAMLAGGLAAGLLGAAGLVVDSMKKVIALVNSEVAAFASVGKEAAEATMGAFNAVLKGKIPDAMSAFNVLEHGFRTLTELPFNTLSTAIDATVGHIPIVGTVFKSALDEVKTAMGGLYGVFDEFKNIGGGFIQTLIDIGTKYTEMARTIAGQTLDTKNIESYAGIVADIMASGAIVHFNDVADSIGRLGSNIAGMDLSQLKELTTTFAYAEELVGHIDETKFTGIINAFGIGAEGASEALTHLVNIARDTGINFNLLTDEMTRSGPAMRELGYSADQTATFFALMTQQGEKGTRLIFGMNEIVTKLQNLVAKGAETSVQAGWESLLNTIQKLGYHSALSADLLRSIGAPPASVNQLLDMMEKGTLSFANGMPVIKGINDNLTEGVEKTLTLGQAMETAGHQMEAALSPIGIHLGTALTGASRHIIDWLKENQGKVAKWGADFGGTFMHVMGEVTKFMVDTLQTAAPYINSLKDLIVHALQGILAPIRGISSVLQHLPSALGGDVFRDLVKGIDEAWPALQKLNDTNLSAGITELKVRTDSFVGSTLPHVISGMRDEADAFDAVNKVAKALSSTVDGELTDAFKILRDETGGVGTAEHPAMRLLGTPERQQQIKDELRRQNIELQTAGASGLVTGVDFLGSDDDKKKAAAVWAKFFTEAIALANKNKPMGIEVKPTKDGKDISDDPSKMFTGTGTAVQMPTAIPGAGIGPASGVAIQIGPAAPAGHFGGSVAGLAEGGVSGAWWPGRDSIPAVLEAGEYVIRRSAVAKPGMRDHLDAINYGGFAGFADGGEAYPGYHSSIARAYLLGALKGMAKEIGLDLPWIGKRVFGDLPTMGYSPYYPTATTATAPGAAAFTAVPSAIIGAAPPPSTSGVNWDAIAGAESSGNWKITYGEGTPDNPVTGGLQIGDQTWKEYGGTQYAPRAYMASKEQQIAVAEKILKGQGPHAWPMTYLHHPEWFGGRQLGGLIGFQGGGRVGGPFPLADPTGAEGGPLTGAVGKGLPGGLGYGSWLSDVGLADFYAHWLRKYVREPGQPPGIGSVGPHGPDRWGPSGDPQRGFGDPSISVRPGSVPKAPPMPHQTGGHIGGGSCGDPSCGLCGGGLIGFQGGGGPTAPGAGTGAPPLKTAGAQVDTIAIALAIQKFFGINDIGMYRAVDQFPEHPSGEAADVMVGLDNMAVGNAVKDFAMANAGNFDVLYAIWQNQYWYPGKPPTPYGSHGSVTDQHRDHVHIRTAGGGYPAGAGKPAGAPTPEGTKSTPAPAGMGFLTGAPGGPAAPGAGGAGGGVVGGAGLPPELQLFAPAQQPILTGPQGPLPAVNPFTGQIPAGVGPYQAAQWQAAGIQYQTELQTGANAIRDHSTQLQQANADIAALRPQYDRLAAAVQAEIDARTATKVAAGIPEAQARAQAEVEEQSTDLYKALKSIRDRLQPAEERAAKLPEDIEQEEARLAELKAKGFPRPEMDQKYYSIAEQTGAGLIRGAFQELGFPDVFGKAFTSWGLWKLAMGGLGYGMGLYEQIKAARGGAFMGTGLAPGPVVGTAAGPTSAGALTPEEQAAVGGLTPAAPGTPGGPAAGKPSPDTPEISADDWTKYGLDKDPAYANSYSPSADGKKFVRSAPAAPGAPPSPAAPRRGPSGGAPPGQVNPPAGTPLGPGQGSSPGPGRRWKTDAKGNIIYPPESEPDPTAPPPPDVGVVPSVTGPRIGPVPPSGPQITQEGYTGGTGAIPAQMASYYAPDLSAIGALAGGAQKPGQMSDLVMGLLPPFISHPLRRTGPSAPSELAGHMTAKRGEDQKTFGGLSGPNINFHNNLTGVMGQKEVEATMNRGIQNASRLTSIGSPAIRNV